MRKRTLWYVILAVLCCGALALLVNATVNQTQEERANATDRAAKPKSAQVAPLTATQYLPQAPAKEPEVKDLSAMPTDLEVLRAVEKEIALREAAEAEDAVPVESASLKAESGITETELAHQAEPAEEARFQAKLNRENEIRALYERAMAGESLSEDQKDLLYANESWLEPRGREGSVDATGGPDAFGYYYVDNVGDTATYTWIELKGAVGVTWLPASVFTSMDGSVNNADLPIGFSFPFYGSDYTTFRVSTDGNIQFIPTYNSGGYTSCIPNGTVLRPAIMAMMDDLHLQRGGIASGDNVIGYKNFGDYTVIQFDSIGRYNTGSGSFNFQAILYQDGKVKVQVRRAAFYSATYDSLFAIGIQQGGASNPALQYVCDRVGNCFGGFGLDSTINRAIWFYQLFLENDFRTSSLLSPDPLAWHEPNSTADVSAIVKNVGTSSNSAPVYYIWNDGTPVGPINTATLDYNETEQVDFATQITMPATEGTYVLKVYTDLATDQDRENDTLFANIVVGYCYDQDLGSTLPVSLTNETTCGFGNDHFNTCLGSYDGDEEKIYKWTVTTAGEYTITMTPLGGATWTGFALDDACPPDPTTCLAIRTSSDATPRVISAMTLQPGTYYIMVDIYPSPYYCFDFDLSIVRLASCEEMEICGTPAETEPNNQCAVFDAYVMGCNDVVYGRHCPEPDSDWFKITVPAQTMMTLALFDGEDCDVTPPTTVRYSYRAGSCAGTLKGPYTTPQNYVNCTDNPVDVYVMVYGAATLVRSTYKFTTTCTTDLYCGTPTETEPNNQCATYDVYDFGCDDEIYGLQCPENDSAWFKVTVSAQTMMTLALFDGADCDVTPPTTVRFSFREGSCTGTLKGPYTTPQAILNCTDDPADVYVMVYQAATAQFGRFKLTTTCTTNLYCGTPTETEPNNQCANFDPYVLDCTNNVVFGLHCPGNDSDFYQVNIPAGSYVTIKAYSGPNCDVNPPTTNIYTQLYTTACVASGSAGTANKTVNRCAAETDTTVYLLVKNYGTTTQYTGPYKIEVACGLAPTNDDCANAIPVAIGSSTPGHTFCATVDAAPICDGYNPATSGPGVWYSFVGNGSQIEVGTCNANTPLDTRVNVYTGDCGNLLCVTGDDDDCTTPSLASLDTVCADEGVTYYVLVYNYSTGTVPNVFQLDLRDLGVNCALGRCCYGYPSNCVDTTASRCAELGGSWLLGQTCVTMPCDTARPCANCYPNVSLDPVPTAYGQNLVNGDCGWGGRWTGEFTAAAGGTYHFDVCPNAPGDGTGNFDADIKILDASCAILVGQDGSCSGGPNTYLPNDYQWTAPASGTYYVTFAPYSSYGTHNCTGSVSNTFTLDYYYEPPCPEIVCTPTVEEVEPNLGCLDANQNFNEVTCNAIVHGTVTATTSIRDVDAFYFELASPQVVTITVDPEFNAIVWLYRTDGFTICPDILITAVDDGANCEDEVLVSPCLPVGRYHIYVAPTFTTLPERDYCMTISCTPCEVQFGRCCYGADPFDPTCVDGVTLFACDDLDGTWTEGLTCNTPCPTPPMCPEGTEYGQRPHVPTESWQFATSDQNPGYTVFDDFYTMNAPIGTVTFWGVTGYHNGSAWTLCSEDPMPFEIKFYGDDPGNPGYPEVSNPVCTYNVTLTGTPTPDTFPGSVTWTQYEWTAQLNPPCSINPGWISIQGAGDGNCWFLWASSPEGNGTGRQWDGVSWLANPLDRGFCFAAGECDPVEDVTVYMAPGNTNTWLHFTAPSAGSYNVYSSTVPNNDGDPRDSDPDFTLETTLTALTNNEVMTWTDPGALVPYKNYVVLRDCSLPEPTGRCCYGEPTAPSCVDGVTDSECDALGGTWTWNLNCTDNPCPIAGLGENCTAPYPISGEGTWTGFTTCGLVNDYAETCLGYYDGGEDMIFEWTVTTPGVYIVTLDPLGTTWTGVGVSDVCPPGATCLAYHGQSGGTAHSTPSYTYAAGTYYIMVDTWPTPDCIPSFNLTIAAAPPPPANDECVNAIQVFNNVPVAGNNTLATTSTQAAPTCQTNFSHDVWYTYTATADGTVTVSTCNANTNFDTVVAIYDACGGTQVGCDDDACVAYWSTASIATFTATNGQTYYIRVASYSTNSGPFELLVTQ